MSRSAKRGRPERRPLRKVLYGQPWIGTNTRLQLILECGHRVTRNRIGPEDVPAQARCDECEAN